MTFDFDQTLILEDNSTKLEPLEWRHLALLLPITLAEPDLLKYSPVRFGTEDFLKEYFQNALRLKDQKLRYPFAIFDKNKSQYAGSTSFMDISNANACLEIGSTWVGKTFQRTGLNRHCKFLLLRYAFETLQFERVAFKTDSRNDQSRKAIEAVGATFEGAMRNHLVMPDGYRRTSVFYSILKSEWAAIKESIFKQQLRQVSDE